MDEIALVNNQPLSLQDYLLISSQLKNQRELALWVGVAITLLQGSIQNSSTRLSKLEAYNIVRYSIHEMTYEEAEKSLKRYYSHQESIPHADQIRRDLEKLTEKATITKNLALLNSLH